MTAMHRVQNWKQEMIGIKAYHDKVLYTFTLLYFTFTSTD